jgi:hypothetical protein
MKYEVKTKDRENLTYGIWNNDMCSFQFINDWNGNETTSLEEANSVAERLNSIPTLDSLMDDIFNPKF